jgi:hypothetical protein
MNAVELLQGEAQFIADTSAWWRLSSLPDELGGIAVLHRDTHFNKLAEVLAFENVELPGA